MNPNACRSCGAPVRWGLLAGKPHPWNADGTSHFTSCPQAEAWRRDQEKARAERAELDARQGDLFGSQEGGRADH